MSLGTLLQIPAVSDYYFEADFDSAINEILSNHHVSLERADEFLDLITALLDDKITVSDVPLLVSEAFGLDTPRSQALTCELLGKTVLPLANYLPGLEQGIIDLGGKLADYPTLRIVKEARDFVALATQKAASVGITLDDVLAKRLLFLLQQYAKKDKTEDSLKTFFTRASSIGGLGLTPDQATSLLQVILPLASSLLDNLLPASLESGVQKNDTLQVSTSDEHELTLAPSHVLLVSEQPASTTRGLPVVAEDSSVAPLTPAAAAAIIKAAANETVTPKVPATDQLQSAPVTAQSQPAVRVTPVTTKPSITNAIQAPAKASEIAPDKADLKLPAKKAEDAKKIVAPVKDSLSAAIELATNQARETLKKTKISEKVFTDTAEKAMKGIRDIYQTRDLVEREWKLAGADLAAVMQAVTVGIEAYHQALPKAEVPKSVVQPTSVSDQAHLDEKFAHMTQASSEKLIPPVKAQLTVGSANLHNQDGQRKMVDVVNTPRLMGPIEQLGTMTPMEFRRLSSNPSDACQKVEDLLAALETTSYEDRIQGVMAWRDSPVNQLYLSIAQEAISQSLALPEVSSRRRTAGQDSLSPAEIKALALLNAKIRF